MELLGGTRWHGYYAGHQDGCSGSPAASRLNTAKSHASLLGEARKLTRTSLDGLGLMVSSLGLSAGNNGQVAAVSKEDTAKSVALHRLQKARSYEEWSEAAAILDELEGAEQWKRNDFDIEYNADTVRSRLHDIEAALLDCDRERLTFLIRTALTRDVGGLGSVNLYKHCHIGTKHLIERYIKAVENAIAWIVENTKLSRSAREATELWETMKAARQSFGRTALLLSGGGTLGMNHIGVLKALFDNNLLPRIISGASAGSIVCAVVCTKTDAEIPEVLSTFPYGDLDVFEEAGHETSLIQRATRLLKEGALYDVANLKRVMRNLLGDITFQEAYNRTRRILNIGVTGAGLYEMPQLLNYVTAPDVVIWSAVAASCSVPGVFTPACLEAKDSLTGEISEWDPTPSAWIDGSVDSDLPMTRLSEMFNVNHFIVSQVNPHVIPFLAREADEIIHHRLAEEPGFAPGPGWFNYLATLSKDEVLQRMHTFAEFGAFPNVTTKLRSVLGQRYSGDITIMPEIPYVHFLNILNNPTPEFMEEALLNGERATWPKITRIRNHVAIELKLDWAVHCTLQRVVFSPSAVDLRLSAFAQAVAERKYRRGRSRRGSRASATSAFEPPVSRPLIGRAISNLPPRSMGQPPATPSVAVHSAAQTQYEAHQSSSDEIHSPVSSSPSDHEYDSSDEDGSQTSASPPPEIRPAGPLLFASASQPATPSVASKAFRSSSPHSSRTPTPGPSNVMANSSRARVPSSPETKYKRLFHQGLHPMPTIRSQAATPDLQASGSGSNRDLSRRRSRIDMNIDLRLPFGQKRRSASTGLPGLEPPKKR